MGFKKSFSPDGTFHIYEVELRSGTVLHELSGSLFVWWGAGKGSWGRMGRGKRGKEGGRSKDACVCGGCGCGEGA